MKKILRSVNLLEVVEYLTLILGCFIISISFNLFLCPNKIASGGIPGLSIVFHKLFGIKVAYIQWGINLPLFFLGLLRHGSNFGLKTAVGSFVIPLFILLTQSIPALSHNILVASIFGGAGVGIGLGFVFRSKGSVGGFSLLAQIMHDYTKMKLSSWIMILNMTVILLAGFTFSFSGALYALISLAITCAFIDVVQFILNLRQNNKFKKLSEKGLENCEYAKSFKNNI